MKKLLTVILLSFLCMLSACSDRLDINEGAEQTDVAEQPVLLSVGNEGVETRATVQYMPNGVRFTAMMMQKARANGDYIYTAPTYAYMIVDNKSAGNSLYYKKDYPDPTLKDHYENDDDATIFYWQNRLEHVFIGFIDDYSKAYTGTAASSTYMPKTLSGWKALPEANMGNCIITKAEDDASTPYRWQQFELYNLKEKAANTPYTKISEMPDPLVAVATKAPTGSSAETNRVYLTFRHQLAQVQVNLKGSAEGGSDITAENIKGVELWGVAEKVRVFPYPEYGYVSTDDIGKKSSHLIYHGTDKTLLRPVEGVNIDLSNYPASTLEKNKWGSEFKMFDMSEPESGYLRSYEAVAYGNLQAIRIHWEEPEDTENHLEAIPHDITYVVTKDEMKQLQSGKRYIFNFELRRGTLAVIKAEILDWIPYTGTYSADGTIVQ